MIYEPWSFAMLLGLWPGLMVYGLWSKRASARASVTPHKKNKVPGPP